MRRWFVVFAVTLASIVVPARPALAIWDWLEEFSGPGPFRGYTVIGTGCWRTVSGTAQNPTPVTRLRVSPLLDADERFLNCMYADFSVFPMDKNTPHVEFRRLNVKMYDFGGSIRLLDGIDLGAGAGWLAFRAEGNDATHNVFTLTPFRFVARPALLALPKDFRRGKPWLGAISVYWKEIYVAQHLTGEDFGVDNAKFNSQGDLVRSIGMTIDVTAALTVIPKFRQ